MWLCVEGGLHGPTTVHVTLHPSSISLKAQIFLGFIFHRLLAVYNDLTLHIKATIIIEMSSVSSYATGPTATSVPTALPPPIVQILPYISQAASFLLTTTTITFRTLFSLIIKISSHLSIISPLPIILYVLAPIIVFSQILIDLLVFTPYSIAVYALDAFYPIYVFCGVACIAGATIGVIARGIAVLLVSVTEGPRVDSESEVAEQLGYQTGTSVKVEGTT